MTKPKKLTPDELDTINKQVQSTLINSAWYVDVKKLLTHIAAVTAERDIAIAAVHELARLTSSPNIPEFGEPDDKDHIRVVGTKHHPGSIFYKSRLPNTWAVLTGAKWPSIDDQA